MEITFAENFKETVSDNAIPIKDYIKSEFIRYVNNVKGYTYIIDKNADDNS